MDELFLKLWILWNNNDFLHKEYISAYNNKLFNCFLLESCSVDEMRCSFTALYHQFWSRSLYSF